MTITGLFKSIGVGILNIIKLFLIPYVFIFMVSVLLYKGTLAMAGIIKNKVIQ